MTCWYAAAMDATVLQESPISVPPWSALQPPNEGMTSPPSARTAWMSLRNVPAATVWVLEPFQASVQEVLLVVSRNARVRYFTPEVWATALIESLVHISKYGA